MESSSYLAVIKVVGVGGGGPTPSTGWSTPAFRCRVHRGEHGQPGAQMTDADIKLNIGSS